MLVYYSDGTQVLFYTDPLGRIWQYWPSSAARKIWREARCNQFECGRPARFVGVVDVFGDGREYFDGAAAWCYWGMPREAMSPEAERMARHAEWARRVTVDECVDIIKRARYEAPEGSTLESVLARLIDNIRPVAESRESRLADSILPDEVDAGRELRAVVRYEERPEGEIVD